MPDRSRSAYSCGEHKPFQGRRPNAPHLSRRDGLNIGLPGYHNNRSTIRVTNRAPLEVRCQQGPESEAPSSHGTAMGRVHTVSMLTRTRWLGKGQFRVA